MSSGDKNQVHIWRSLGQGHGYNCKKVGNDINEWLSSTASGNEFQTAGAEKRTWDHNKIDFQ